MCVILMKIESKVSDNFVNIEEYVMQHFKET